MKQHLFILYILTASFCFSHESFDLLKANYTENEFKLFKKYEHRSKIVNCRFFFSFNTKR